MSSTEPLQVQWADVNKARFVGIGFILGFCENLALYPFEVVKVHMQAETNSLSKVATSPWVAARDLMTSSGKGARALYRGFFVQTVGSAPATVFYLAAYNKLKQEGNAYCQRQGADSVLLEGLVVPLIAGATADLTSLVIYSPVDVVTTHMQRVSGHYVGSLPAIVKAIAREEGVRGFYRGVTASALTFTPASALWWPAYEGSKMAFGHFLVPHDGMSSASNVAMIVAASGAVAGAVASGLTNPMDLVRTRMVLGHGCYGEKNPLRIMAKVVRNEGLAALAKGVVPRVLQSTPASALASFTYELALRLATRGFD